MSSSRPGHEGANNGTAGMRTATVKDLKTLKTLEEGGNKKDFDDFLEEIIMSCFNDLTEEMQRCNIRDQKHSRSEDQDSRRVIR